MRKDARDHLTDLLKRLTAYLEFVAQQDPAKLASTGYDQRKETVRASHTTALPAPTDVRIAHGTNSGTLDIHVARLEGAKSYKVDIAQGDHAVEATETCHHLGHQFAYSAGWANPRIIRMDKGARHRQRR